MLITRPETMFPCAHILILCSHFNLSPLSNRRQFLEVNFLYKVLNGTYNCPNVLSKLCLRAPSRRLRSCDLFYIPRSRLDIYKYSPLLRCMSSFNNLGHINPEIDIFSSIYTFRRSVLRTLQ